jgi:hypothetical protein
LPENDDVGSDATQRSLHETAAKLGSVRQTLDPERAREADDRSWIARRVINGFAVPIVTLVLRYYFGRSSR